MIIRAEPINPIQRHKSLDVLRGFALMGIFAANVYVFDVDGFSEVETSFKSLSFGAADVPFGVFTAVFVLNKMMALFSMLFGAGILLLVDRLEQRNVSAVKIHYTRNTALAGVGLLHTLLWFGDVLHIYAVCAFLLFPIRRWSIAKLFTAGSLVWLAVLMMSFWTSPSGIIADYVLRALAMMLFGMAFYRAGVFTLKRSTIWYRKRSRRFLGLGLPVCTVAWGFSDVNESLSTMIHNLGVPFVAFGYVCFITNLLLQGKIPKLADRLASAGQMALTNYLLQTVIGSILVQAVNQFRGQRLTVLWMMLITLVIWALQLSWSKPWMKRFYYGPAEWLWRSLTYRKVQPFRIKSPTES